MRRRARSWLPLGAWLLCACSTPEPVPTVTAEGTAPSASATTTAASAAQVGAGKPVWIDAPASADFASTVRLERMKAQKAGRLLVVYVGADWCPPCKAFHRALLAGELDRELAKVTFLAFDFDRDAARMGAYGYKTTHIPYFVKPGPDAKPDDAFKITTMDGARAIAEAVERLQAWQKP